MRNLILLGFICVFVFLLASFSQPALAAGSLIVETVADQVWDGGSTPLAVDSNGTPHIAYPDPSVDGVTVTYLSRIGSNWTEQYVDTGEYGFKKVWDLNIDPNGNAWIAFSTHWGGDLGVSSWNGSGWDIHFVGDTSGEASIAFDSRGIPHMAYTASSEVTMPKGEEKSVSLLKYATWNGERWTKEVISTDVNGAFKSISLAIDKNDTPYVLSSLVLGDYNSTTKLARTQNQNWVTINAPLSTSNDGIGNIALDSEGSVHFVFAEHYLEQSVAAYRSKILYVSYSGGTWDTETVATNVWFNGFSKLVFDNQDNPRFVYSRDQGEGRYVTCSSGNWIDNALPSNVKGGSLAIDKNGNLHLSSRTHSEGRYITDLVYSYLPESCLSGGSLVLTLDSTGLVALVVVAFFVAIGLILVFWRLNTKIVNKKKRELAN